MQKIKFIAPVILAIGVMVLDYKFNAFKSIKFSVNFLTTPIYKIIDYPFNIYDYLNTTDNTEQLTKEILVLKSKINNYNSLLLENKKLSDILETSYQITDNNFVLARISNIKQSRLRKHIVINAGSEKNITTGDVVIASNGVVGRIISSNYGHSTVRLMSDPLSYIPVMNVRNGQRGIVQGVADNSNHLIIKYQQQNADIKIGDNWTTSGKGGVFTKNFLVGKVIDIKQTDSNFIDIILTPAQNINKTTFVLIDT